MFFLSINEEKENIKHSIRQMRYKYKSCILLTACVNPQGMPHTTLQDSRIRAEQYKRALDFYLCETRLPIIFCENTMYDMSSDYFQYIESGRLEYLTFDGNDYDKRRGKGYGEAIIMKFAIDHSRIISNSKYVIKVTGRLIITNITRYSSSVLFQLNNLFRSNINDNFIATYLFIARPKLILLFIERHKNLIQEIPPNKESIEYQWYRALTKDTELNNTTYIPFISIPNVVGISGTTGKPYSMEDRRIWNFAYSYRFELARNNKILAHLHLTGYYVFYFANQLKIKIGLKSKN